jgi:predicted amidohydrolase
MRAGVFQCAGGGLTPDQRLERLAAALDGTELDLVVCPELFMSGYDVGDAIAALAEPRGGPFARQVAELARQTGMAIVYGYPERDGQVIYNSAACIDASGHVVANHRKLVLPPGFETTYFAPGAGLTLFDLAGVRCGLLICYDAEHPETVRAAAEAGAQVVIVPTALVQQWGTVALQLMPTRAFENGVWLLYANHAGSENNSRYLGASCIVAPDGKDAARAGAQEELIVADLDMARVAAMQARLPYLRDVKQLRRALAQ